MFFKPLESDPELEQVLNNLRKDAQRHITREKAMKIFDGDFEEIQSHIFNGLSVSDALPIEADSEVAVPQGHPFLSDALSITQILRRFGGIHSIK
jgi:hypothetical protein